MTHISKWCGCDPTHLPTHAKGETDGCRYNTDPKQKLISETEEFLKLDGRTMPGAASLLQRWLDVS